MADEDEVDILGDFTFDNFFHKEDSRISACYDSGVLGAQTADQLLHDCINPAWLLEPSQPCWFSPPHETERQRTSPAAADDRSALGFTSLGSSGSLNWEEAENSWSEREKSLLDRGIELFGRSWTRVAQLVGSKTAQQVRQQARLMGLAGVSSVSESSEHQDEEVASVVAAVVEPEAASGAEGEGRQSFNFTELIDDMAIPASMEEVIAVVTTAQPTVHSPSPPSKRQRRRSSSDSKHTPLLLPSLAPSRPSAPSRGRGRTTNSILKPAKRGRPKKRAGSQDSLPAALTIHEKVASEVNVISAAKDPLPIRVVSEGEQLVRIQKENDASEDSEIEIDDDDVTVPPTETPIKTEPPDPPEENGVCEAPATAPPVADIEIKEEPLDPPESEQLQEDPPTESAEKVFYLTEPKEEVLLDPEVISEEEKEIHHEFFTGRLTKTPSRYLKIRNHITECWQQNRPSYVSKTSVRAGLKNCGDVNCVGRIHAYLECVGAINFGCSQTQYRPLIVPLNYCRGNTGSTSSAPKANRLDGKLGLGNRTESTRPRKKKVDHLYVQDSDGEGGCTISHDVDGSVVNSHVYPEPRPHREPRERKPSQHEQLRLLYCHKFSELDPAPFSVVLDIGALLLMDVHAHSCRSEVIGLLGGRYDATAGVLHISRGLACKSESTGVQCDMCPVSQTEASEQLQDAGLEVVGWYHSHPTFLPNPSNQDLDTQLRVQQYFARTDLPFVGIIIAPYFHANKTLASSYKCLIVQEGEEGERKPFQFPVRVVASQTCGASLVGRISEVFNHLGQGQGTELVPYYEASASHAGTSFLDKLLGSVRCHMEVCQPPMSREERATLLTGILRLCQLHAKVT